MVKNTTDDGWQIIIRARLLRPDRLPEPAADLVPRTLGHVRRLLELLPLITASQIVPSVLHRALDLVSGFKGIAVCPLNSTQVMRHDFATRFLPQGVLYATEMFLKTFAIYMSTLPCTLRYPH